MKKLGLISCIAIVAGNMMSSGIALLPSTLAAIGSITVFSWIIATIGAIALAYIYAKLAVFNPQQGGPIAYATEVAPILGYQAGLLYFHANWIGNVAIAITAITYLSDFFPALEQSINAGIATIIVLWLLTFLNLLGPKWVARFNIFGVALLLIPVLLTGTIGWIFFDKAQFLLNWNMTTETHFHALTAGIVLCLWSFIGLESASTNAGLTENPKKTIPRSTIIGILIAAIAYISSSTAISGMFSAQTLVDSGAPFGLAVHKITGFVWAEKLASIFTTFACLTSLGSWMMLVAQAGLRAAKEKSLIKAYGKVNKNNIPVAGLILTSIMMTFLMLGLMFFSKDANQIFDHVVSIAVLLTIFPYFYTIANFFNFITTNIKEKKLLSWIICALATLFCLSVLAGSSDTVLFGTIAISLIVILLYARKKRTQGEIVHSN